MISSPEQYTTIYDISVSLGTESVDYPGDTKYIRDLILTIRESGICDVSKLTMSAHSGTHLDAPSHQIQNAKTIDQYPVQNFILPAHVVPIEDKESITSAELEKVNIQKGYAILFKTENSISGRCISGKFSEKYIYLSAEAADLCVEKHVRLVGIDYAAIDRFDDVSRPAHNKLLGNDILILEGVNLKEVPPGEYTLFCLPLKIAGGDGSPVRAILV
jgi:arylformamidase